MKRRQYFQGFVTGLLLALAAVGGILLALRMSGVLWFTPVSETAVSGEAVKKANTIERLIERNYYEEVETASLEDGMLQGMVDALDDPYSTYFTAEEYKEQVQSVTRQYYGIGATLTQDPDTMEVRVVYVYPDTPAERGGLLPEDQVLSVDGVDATSLPLDDLVERIHGEEGSTVVLTVRRDNGEPIDLPLERGVVSLPTVTHELFDGRIGYIYLMSFASNTPKEFSEALEDLKARGMQGLILDIRYNTGGIVDSCVDILDQLLPEGTVVYTEDRNGSRVYENSDAEHSLDLPLVVLTNERSASASEILAGAIRDFHWGTLLGTTTYGKGVVQKTYTLEDGSAVKLTAEQYFTPSGENIHGVGITPDIELEYEFLGGEEDTYSYEYDNQIQKAIELLEEGETLPK